jgi:hypothetical protein
VSGNAAVELTGQTTDGGLVTNVCGSEPAGGQAAEMEARLEENHSLAEARRLHGSNNAR